MKRLLLLALCALLSLNADARTLYVDARRPNNNGNGLSKAKAKKTLQAAINVAKNGDTIMVLPGTYAAPVKTNNKKIKIRSKSGAGSTFVVRRKGFYKGFALDLGKGTATAAAGLTIDGNGYEIGGVRGGTLSNCTLAGLGRIWDGPARTTFSGTKMTACLLDGCYTDSYGMKFMASCTLNRCKIFGTGVKNYKKYAPVVSSRLANCLFADNSGLSFSSCVLANCTVAENKTVALKGNKAYNTIFHKVPSSQFKNARKNKLKNCYKGANPKFVATKASKKLWDNTDESEGEEVLVGAEVAWNLYDVDGYWQAGGTVVVSGATDAEILAAAKAKAGEPDAEYEINFYDYNYVRYVGDYHIAAGSPCIDKGNKSSTVRKLFGSKDLDGKKRVKGKSVDIGCYEY